MDLQKYRVTFESPPVDEFIRLRKKVGWNSMSAESILKSLTNSLFHVVIRHQTKLIGMGRVIGDGVMYFYVQDVVVDPDYQKQGIGNALMKEIEAYLNITATKGATIGLLSAKGKENFYNQFGYIQRPSDALGSGMCKFL